MFNNNTMDAFFRGQTDSLFPITESDEQRMQKDSEAYGRRRRIQTSTDNNNEVAREFRGRCGLM